MTAPELELRYHVPRSQVWGGSRGGQSGNVHLHVTGELVSGRLRRSAGRALCSSRPAWYERELDAGELERLPAGLCPRCVAAAGRHGLEVPSGRDELELRAAGGIHSAMVALQRLELADEGSRR